MHRLKVLQFIGSTKWGGAEKVFVELSNQLAMFCELYVVLLRNTDYAARLKPDIQLINTKFYGSRRNLFLLVELGRIISQVKPDIVHTHAAKATEMIHYIKKFQKFHHVATKHNARKGKIFNKIFWVTTVSAQARATIKNPGKVKVIYNGIIPRKISPQKKSQPFSIIAVGRLDRYKGFDLLINEVRKLSFDFTLRIVGEGPERKNLEKLIQDLHLVKKVFLLGHREDVPELLGQSHLQVISSRNEGFSLVLAEGLFYSDVVISRKVGIAPEILANKLLVADFNIASAIAEVHNNYDHFLKLFQSTKNMHRDRFRLPDITQRYLQLYNKVLEQ